MIRTTATNTESELGDLSAIHINARRRRLEHTFDVVEREKLDQSLLDMVDKVADAEFAALEIEEEVEHPLAGAVVGDLAAAVDLDDGDIAGGEDVFGFAGLTLGEDAGVLQEPELVGCVGAARVPQKFL